MGHLVQMSNQKLPLQSKSSEITSLSTRRLGHPVHPDHRGHGQVGRNEGDEEGAVARKVHGSVAVNHSFLEEEKVG